MLIDSFKKCDLFSELNDSELQTISQIVQIRKVPAGSPIVTEGVEAISLFAVETGSVDVLKNSDDGMNPRITQLYEGEIFGEIAFLDHANRSAGVVAHTDATIFEIHYSDLEKIMSQYPPIGLKLYRAMAVSLSKKTKRTTHDLVSLVSASRMAALGELTSGIAHEVKTPLTSILLNTEMLEQTYKNSPNDIVKINERISAIKSTVQRVVSIVEGLSGISRNRSGDPFVQVSIKKLIDDVLVLFSEKLKNHNVSLEVIHENDLTSINIRNIQISQVLINLLNNALDANDHPSISERWIRIETKLNGIHLEISVTDAGHGIDQRLHDKIFQPFFTTKGNDIGTGLGLSISRGIVERHGGMLILKTESPHTQFVLSLPKHHS